HGTGGFDRVLVGIADFATSRALAIVLVSAVVMVLAIGGLFSLRFSMNFHDWFPKDLELRKGIELVDERFKGSMNLEVVVDTGKENGLYEPMVLNQMEALARYAEQQAKPDGRHYVGKTNSVVDVLKETNKALNENREEFYTVPQNRKLIAQELLLFENSGSDDLENVVDSQLGKARLSLIVPWDDTEVYVDFVRDLRREAESRLAEFATVTITGELNLFTQMIFTMMQSMAQSYLIAVVVITIMMMLLVGSFRIGLLSMIANLAPIVLTMGLIMGYFDIRLDVFTLLIGSIALGLAVDDTIHFFHNFRRYFGEGKSVQEAVRETLLTTGRAMMFTTLVLVIGFWLFMFATLNNVFNFGLLTGIALLFALAADFLLAPAMLTLVIRSSYGRTLTERWCNLEPAVEGD
ncbi:MAG: efflux RND transporter permease subunit, partial [SAR324 cluster bacterium]|nr:efflux RND transporter permease subunit [SAR324 cluster bacterium]